MCVCKYGKESGPPPPIHTHIIRGEGEKGRDLGDKEGRVGLRELVYKEGGVGLESCLVRWGF